MDRKFLTLLSKYEQQQTKIDQIAEKMLFYMEKCGSAVEEQRIAEDITFL